MDQFFTRFLAVLVMFSFLGLMYGADVFAQDRDGNRSGESSRRINHDDGRENKKDSRKTMNKVGMEEFRTIDGSGNNLNNTEMGATFTQLLRLVNLDYADGISELAGSDRPGAREVSNIVNDQEDLVYNDLDTTDFLWQWGQFVDHDIDLTDAAIPLESADITVPTGDIYFDPDSTGTQVIFFNRSIFDSTTGTDVDNPREQLNEITSWIDASNVYGSDEERATALRTNDGTGKLETSDGDLLPFNLDEFPNAGGPGSNLFLAGDVRANEQVALTAMHTLFVREHNRQAEKIAEINPDYTGDQIYEKAREIVAAEIQFITYNEFLPALLGNNAIGIYRRYEPDIDAGILNNFSAAAYRFGHSALNPTLLRLDSNGEEISAGHLALRNAFFAPAEIINEGIEPYLRGLAKQRHQKIDPLIIDDVRNFLFGPPGSGGLDLASLNIQRGRDHGIASYNDTREALGLQRAGSFADISSDTEVQNRLAEVYSSVDDVDLWIGGICEDALENSHLGELFSTILIIQFESLRDGDRFWFERSLSDRQIEEVKRTKLSDIIIRNTEIESGEIQSDVFRFSELVSQSEGCTLAAKGTRSSIPLYLIIPAIFILIGLRRRKY